MIDRIRAGTPQAHVAEQMSVSRAIVAKWWRRWLARGDADLEDRSSRPKRTPTPTPAKVKQRICRLRKKKRWGPRRIGMESECRLPRCSSVMGCTGCGGSTARLVRPYAATSGPFLVSWATKCRVGAERGPRNPLHSGVEVSEYLVGSPALKTRPGQPHKVVDDQLPLILVIEVR